MAADPARLYTLLLNTGLQQKNNPLHQIIHTLIGAILDTNKQVNTVALNSGSSSSGSIGPQGPQGLQGSSGTGLPGIDGLDGVDGISYPAPPSSGVDYTFTVAIPLTGNTVVMNVNQQRLIVNPAGTLLALTVTLPATPFNGQIAGMSFTQVITGLTINAPGGATVVAPPASAAVDSTFRFIYQASSTSWFPTA